MQQIELKHYYPAGGSSSEERLINDISTTGKAGVLLGRVMLPNTTAVQKVIIYELLLENGNIDIRTIPALCPHQGADISEDKLKADGNVYCSWHRRPICVYSEYNQAFAVEKRGDDYILLCSN